MDRCCRKGTETAGGGPAHRTLAGLLRRPPHKAPPSGRWNARELQPFPPTTYKAETRGRLGAIPRWRPVEGDVNAARLPMKGDPLRSPDYSGSPASPSRAGMDATGTIADGEAVRIRCARHLLPLGAVATAWPHHRLRDPNQPPIAQMVCARNQRLARHCHKARSLCRLSVPFLMVASRWSSSLVRVSPIGS